MTARVYLLAALMLLATSCGDSNNKGPEYLFVQNSRGAIFTDSTLTLTGISPNTGWFTDRPYREAGQIPTMDFLTLWGEGENSFADNPPNADFTCTVDSEVVNYVVELAAPYYERCFLSPCPNVFPMLHYDITFIGSDAAEAVDDFQCDGSAHLFIDDSFSRYEDVVPWLD